MKFKVGDRVKFVKEIELHSDKVRLGGIYKIKCVSSAHCMPYMIENEEHFSEKELELANYTYEDLKKSPIGTKITFEDGKFNIRRNEKWFTGEYPREIADLKNLKDNCGERGKIIKIEEPTYQAVYEYKPEILDETEKRYLRGVIRPFKDKVKYIKKYFSRTVGKEYLQVKLKEDRPMNLPYFEVNAMYKGMKKEKEYTLEELGL